MPHPDPFQIQELALALTYLHKQGVVHGDVKGNNILVSTEIKVLLCDFGVAVMADMNSASSRAGSPNVCWAAPEVIESAEPNRRTFQSDVYSFGMTIYEVSTAFGLLFWH